MRDWRNRFNKNPNIEKDTHHLVGEHVLPSSLIRQGGYDPKDFPVVKGPTAEDLQRAMVRIKELETDEKLKLHEASKKLEVKT